MRLLTGPSVNSLVPSITLAGQQISSFGDMIGPLTVHNVPVRTNPPTDGKTTQYVVQLPAAGAALIVMQQQP